MEGAKGKAGYGCLAFCQSIFPCVRGIAQKYKTKQNKNKKKPNTEMLRENYK